MNNLIRIAKDYNPTVQRDCHVNFVISEVLQSMIDTIYM